MLSWFRKVARSFKNAQSRRTRPPKPPQEKIDREYIQGESEREVGGESAREAKPKKEKYSRIA